ncbi:MAG: Flp pilus assembly complex ATPase component TadA, partial [Verrucomicrobiae bacterium]|nr:Flp pilus assembly complex ATPase component TadA [Verrucomicrobiae bacterium]
MSEPSREVGERLFAAGRLTSEQIELVRRRQHRLHIPQHRAVVDLGFVSEEDAWRELAACNGLEFVDLCNYEFPPGLPDEKLFPVRLVHHHRVLPLEIDDQSVGLAFVDPPRQSELSNLRLLLNRRVEPMLTSPSCYQNVIRQHFGLGADTLLRLDEDVTAEEGSSDVVFDLGQNEDEAQVTAGITHYVDQLLAEAMRLGATDVHVEPYFARIKLRYRIDGVLQTVRVPDGLRQVYGALVSRLKIMAGLNIAEKRLPQDGRITMRTVREEYDLRVNTVPTKHGEALCLRILGRQSLMLELKELGLQSDQEETLRDLTRLPQGLVLLTGPTGSG